MYELKYHLVVVEHTDKAKLVVVEGRILVWFCIPYAFGEPVVE